MKRKNKLVRPFVGWLCVLLFLFSCKEERKVVGELEGALRLFPDYAGVTIPYNIAPLNFKVEETAGRWAGRFEGGDKEHSFEVEADNGALDIPIKQWRKLLASSIGGEVKVTLLTLTDEGWKSYPSFSLFVAEQPIDDYLAYRLIEPGYALWNKMGIYQRNLTDFTETAIYENKMGRYNCVNCHSFCNHEPEQLLFHLRSHGGGTVIADHGKVEKIDSRAFDKYAPLVYPCWHPGGRYIAFSSNKTTQDFHPTQRVEVFDTASDVVVYDRHEHRLIVSEVTASPASFETFPAFSPDGKTLYYCSAAACPMPDSIAQLQYHLCSVSFDPEKGVLGTQADTLYNVREQGGSLSFPRISPDGRFLMCTRSAYGTFPIWHKDADLYMIDLLKGEGFVPEPLNTEDTESYHSWSSNGRWVVFSSRRLDGLYTRPFIAYIDEEGRAAKPFLLPQKNTDHYLWLMKSYNLPEFIKGAVDGGAFWNISEEKIKK